MNAISKSLVWAGLILAAAIIAQASDLSDAASFGLVSSFVGVALATTAGRGKSCGKGCA